MHSGTLSLTVDLEKFRHGTLTVASLVNSVRSTTIASLSHWASSFVAPLSWRIGALRGFVCDSRDISLLYYWRNSRSQWFLCSSSAYVYGPISWTTNPNFTKFSVHVRPTYVRGLVFLWRHYNTLYALPASMAFFLASTRHIICQCAARKLELSSDVNLSWMESQRKCLILVKLLSVREYLNIKQLWRKIFYVKISDNALFSL